MSVPPIANNNERLVAQQFSDQGYKVLNRGWPDFLLLRGDEIRLVEVKATCRDALSIHQRLMASALEKAGLTVEFAAAMCVCGQGCRTPINYDAESGDLTYVPPRPSVHDGRHNRRCLVCHPPTPDRRAA